MPKAEEAVRKALELDDKLAEAHNAMAAVYLFRHWDLQQADRESRRAIELNPNFAEAYHLHAYILTAMNRPDEARQEQERSLELDPFARPWALGFVLSYLGQYDAALKELRLRMQGQPRDIMLRVTLSDVYRIKGMEEESAQELQDAYLLSSKPEIAAAVRRVFDEGGDKAVAQWQLINLPLQQDYYSSWWWRARLYARLGDKEKTLAELDTAYQERDPFLIFLQNEPLFDFLHSDQRYRALVKKMGLPFFY
jgi:tetratricopeptide (TPR) repeat protein